jgi:hypothetical protein
VIAKCGEIMVWHWSHLAADCDPWSEGESEWHLAWKSRFPVECREVTMGPHRADVFIGGTVVEFQASPISATEIYERERFYVEECGQRLVWVFRGDDFRDRFYVRGGSFDWRHPKSSLSACGSPVVFDFPYVFGSGPIIGKRELFCVRMFDDERCSAGWGHWLRPIHLLATDPRQCRPEFPVSRFEYHEAELSFSPPPQSAASPEQKTMSQMSLFGDSRRA